MKKSLLLLLLPIPAAFLASEIPGELAEGDCIECHADLIDNTVVHPITEQGCEFCHTPTGEEHPGDKAGFTFDSPFPDMCYMCHDDKNKMSYVHSPVSEGDCSVCHSPHSSKYKSLIRDEFSDNACVDCHYIETKTATTVHGPVGEGRCQDCHDPHQSDYQFTIKKGSKEMCLSCHDEQITVGEREIESVADNLEKGQVIHEPIKSGDCTTCHSPHSGDYANLLIASYPVKQYAEATVENFELCFVCHDSELLTEETTRFATSFRNGNKNLHFLHISGNRGRNCNLCHDLHGAPNKHILQNTVMFGKWEMPLGLELTEHGGSCATGCHKRLEYSRIINE